MRNFPTNPIAQHNRLVGSFCDDLLAGNRDYRTAKAVAEISKQLRETADKAGQKHG